MCPMLNLRVIMLEKRSASAICLQRIQQHLGAHPFGEDNVLDSALNGSSAIHWQRKFGGSLRTNQRDSSANFDVVLVDTNLRACSAPQFKPPKGGRVAAGKRGGACTVVKLLTEVIIRSQRIFDSPCCASFCLLNQMKGASSTTWSFQTSPTCGCLLTGTVVSLRQSIIPRCSSSRVLHPRALRHRDVPEDRVLRRL